MKKLFTLLTMLVIGISGMWAADYNGIKLTFSRAGNSTASANVSDVSVIVTDMDGQAITGVSASLTGMNSTAGQITQLKTGSASALSRTTNSVLAPNNGYDNKQNSTIEYTIRIQGLSTDFVYNKAALDVYALTGAGGYQYNNGNTKRYWTFDVATGPAANATETFVNQANNDICTVDGPKEGDLYHKLWIMAATTDKQATDDLYIKVTLTKTDGSGCFAGIREIQLFKPAATVQYVISYGGSVVFTSPITDTEVGATITDLPDIYKRDYCEYDDISETMGEGENTVDVTMTWSGPFNISASFETAEWKLLQMRQGGYNVKYVAGASSYPIEAKGKMRTEDDAYLWAFIGNPYDGFEIVNKAAGSTMTLYAGASPGNGTYPLMSTDNTTKWLVNGNPKDSEVGGFGLQVPDKSLYINDYSGASKLSFWRDNTSTDAGSTLTIADQYPLLVENNISPYFKGIGEYFSLSASAENLITYGEKWMNAKTTCDKSTYDDLKDYVSDVSHLRYPATGNYRIKNVSSGNYVGYGNAGYSGKGVGLIEVSENDPSSILHLTKVSDGVYTISTQGLNVQKQSTRDIPVRLSLDAGANHTFTPLLGQVVSIRVDQNDDKGYWFRSSWGRAPESIITWSEGSDAAKWRLESASSISISLTAANDNTGSAHTYATLCVPFNVTALTGADDKEVKAYAPTKDGDYIVPGTGATTITEGTPVLLIGEEGATSVTAILGSSYATTPATSNVLTGTFTGTSIDCTASAGTNYILGFDRDNDNRIGFYHVNSSSYSLKPNRAYLHLEASGDARGYNIMFDVDDDATGIVAPIGETEEGTVIYNLSGQRLNKMQKGINIVNGKKVLF